MLALVLRVVAKKPEIEYVHYALQIVELAMISKELRAVVLNEIVRDAADVADVVPEGTNYTWVHFLKLYAETAQEFMSVQKLHTRALRQRRELESWAQAKLSK